MRALLLLTLLSLACSGPKPLPPDAGSMDAEPPAIDCPPRLAPTGECQRDSDCASGACVAAPDVTSADGAPLALVCASTTATADDTCVVGNDCAHGACLVSGGCAVPCVDDADCVWNQVCRRVWVRRGDTATQLMAGCVPRVVLPERATYEARAGAGHVSDSAVPAVLTLPATAGLSVLLPECGATVRGRRLTTGTGQELFGPSAGDATNPPLSPLVPAGRPLTVLLPSGSTNVASPTGYELELDSDGDGDVSIFTFQGESDVGGEVQLELFYVGVPGWAPVGLTPPPEVEDALREAERLFADAGVTFRVVGQHVLTGDLGARLAVVDEEPDGSSPERDELFALSAGLRTPSVPVFFVRAMDRGALGLSGGIPGPQSIMATEGSGVVVAASVVGEERLLLGAVLAHELGHFFGLFHTSEIDGGGVEALGDTPTCGGAADVDGDGYYTSTECVGAGAENLMFWSARAAGEQVTPDQTRVLRSAVLIQP